MKDVVVIGAGPTGLAISYFLLKKYDDINIHILEKENYLGGLGRTETNGRISYDMGPHYFYTTSRQVYDFMNEIMGGKFLERCKVALIYNSGKYYDYPVRLNIRNMRNLSHELLSVGLSYMMKWTYCNKRNLEDYFIRVYGKKLYHIFFEDYTQKVWGLHPSDLPYDFLGGRIERDGIIDILRQTFFRQKNKSKDNLEDYFLYNFLYPQNGCGEFWNKVVYRIEKVGGKIEKDAEIEEIRSAEKIIRYNSKEAHYDLLICTNPVVDTIEYLGLDKKLKHEFEEATAFRSLIFVNIEIENMKIGSEKIDDVHYIYLHNKDIVSGRVTIFSNWSSNMTKTGASSCCLEYYCDINDDLLLRKDAEWIEVAIQDLMNANFIEKKEQILSCSVIKAPRCYPITLNHAIKDEVISEIEKNGIKTLGRMGRHEYISMAKCIEEAMDYVANLGEM